MSEELIPCHRCGSAYTTLSSNRSMQLSQITCGDCGYLLQENLPEEDLVILRNTRADTVTDKETEKALKIINGGAVSRDSCGYVLMTLRVSELETIRKALSRPKHTPLQAKMLRHALMNARCSFHTNEERDAINELLEGL